MTTTTKVLAPARTAPNWKSFFAVALQKISENILDMVITIAALSILLAYLLLTQPLAAVEYGGYIMAIYLMILFRRIVQDFDESWTPDEIGDRVAGLENKLDDVARMVREDIVNDDEILDRLQKVS